MIFFFIQIVYSWRNRYCLQYSAVPLVTFLQLRGALIQPLIFNGGTCTVHGAATLDCVVPPHNHYMGCAKTRVVAMTAFRLMKLLKFTHETYKHENLLKDVFHNAWIVKAFSSNSVCKQWYPWCSMLCWLNKTSSTHKTSYFGME